MDQMSISGQLNAALACAARLREEAAASAAHRSAASAARRKPAQRWPEGTTLTGKVHAVMPKGQENGLSLAGVAVLAGQNTSEGRKRTYGAIQTLIKQGKVAAKGAARSMIYWRTK